jgi:hypothetical protein
MEAVIRRLLSPVAPVCRRRDRSRKCTRPSQGTPLSRHRDFVLASVVALLCLGARAEAGSIHLRWGPDAPEKLAVPNMHLYESLVAYRDAHLDRFDFYHHFYHHLLTEDALMNKIVGQWEAHEERFEYWHPFLWRVLDGYVYFSRINSEQTIQPPIDMPTTSIGDVNGTGGGNTQEPGTGGSTPGEGNGNDRGTPNGNGGGISTTSVPEPSSLLLLLGGICSALLAARYTIRR